MTHARGGESLSKSGNNSGTCRRPVRDRRVALRAGEKGVQTDGRRYGSYLLRLPGFPHSGLAESVINALNWHLRRLVSEKKLFRTGRGQYSVTGRQPFKESPDEELVRRHTELICQYPTVRCCLYKGTIIAPLLLQKEIYPQKSLPNLQQLILCRLLKEFGL